MTEDEKRSWDARMSLVTSLLTVVTITVGVWQISRQAAISVKVQTEAAKTQDKLQFQRKLWSDAAENCTGLTKSAARIAAEVDAGGHAVELTKEWLGQYWGVSLTLDRSRGPDRVVEQAIIDFRADLKDLRSGGFEAQIGDWLKTDAHTLGEACRTMIRSGSSEL